MGTTETEMPVYRKIEVGQYLVPEEAITLVEDIKTMKQILDALETVHFRSITPTEYDHESAKLSAQQMIRRVGFLISGMHSIATDKLRNEFLAGKRIKPRVRQQTLEDVWQMLQGGSWVGPINEKK